MANKFSPAWRVREQSRLEPKRTARFQAALCYPNTYAVGMSNLGIHTIYRELNQRSDTRCERVFSDTLVRGTYRSVESQQPLAGFDIIAISLSYELDSQQAADFVRSIADDPQARPVMPLVIIGGMVTTVNIRPLIPFADIIVIGEAEETLGALMDMLARHGAFATRRQKDQFLTEAAHVPAVFVPGISSDVEMLPRHVRDVNDWGCSSQIVTPHTEFSNIFLVELSRGCPWQCNFCLAGAVGGRFRPRRLDCLLPDLEAGLRLTDKVGLMAAAVSDYPQINELLGWLQQRRARVTVSSLRAESTPEELLRCLARSGQHSVTFAPETGSEILRRSLRKNLKDAQLLEQCHRCRNAGMRSVKLYFMVGLPEETPDDVAGIARLAIRCQGIIPVKLNIGIFVPKPHTVFGRQLFAGRRDLGIKLAYLRRLLAKTGIPVRWASIREAEREYAIAHGDEAVLLREQP